MKMTMQKWRLFVAIVWIFIARGNANIIKKPVDTEVRVGDSTYFLCSASESSAQISWHHLPLSGGTEAYKHVYSNGRLTEPYDRRFRVDQDPSTGAFDLIIRNAELSDAGIYICQEEGIIRQTAKAELTVLGSNPVCVTNINSNSLNGPNSCGIQRETVELSCSVLYAGNAPPDLRWIREKNGTYTQIPESELSCTVSDGHYSCHYSSKTDLDMIGTSFTCSAGGGLYRCLTDLVKIQYALGLGNLTVTYVGDEVTCSVNTNSPSCTYTWIWFDGVYEEKFSKEANVKLPVVGWYRCEASCLIGINHCIFTAITIKAKYTLLHAVAEARYLPFEFVNLFTKCSASVVAVVLGLAIIILTAGVIFACTILDAKQVRIIVLENELRKLKEENRQLRFQVDADY